MRLTAAVAVHETDRLRYPVSDRESMLGEPEVPIWGAG